MKSEKGIDIPDDLSKLLMADPPAFGIFHKMRPSCRPEYVQWITEAKREATRARLSSALTRIREYGTRHGLLDLERA